MIAIVKCSNSVVTDAYMELIGHALSNCDSIKYFGSISECLSSCRRDEVVVVARTVDAFQAIMRGYKRIFMWFQGVEPEESYMSHHSPLRRDVLSMMERTVLNRGKFFFFVSKAMKMHYESKYSITISEDSYYIMPCHNTVFHPETFTTDGKYSKNIYTYVGSLAIWQKFDETIRLYKEIEKTGIPNTELRVFTFQQDTAKEMLRDAGVQHYSVDCVKNEDMPHVLSDVKYGFIIREDNIVNEVATPTKISTYMSCGVIPIYSKCLKGFEEVAKEMKYVICEDDGLIAKLKSLQQIDWKDIRNEYQNVFSRYYDADKHIQVLRTKFNHLLFINK